MEIGKGTKVFITGAASGIGRSTALAAAGFGARLFLTDINKEGLDRTAALISGKPGEVCMARAMDISREDQVRQFALDIHAGYGSMDIVMNIAGIALFAQIEDMTHDSWEKIINVNLWGPIHVLQNFVPAMIRADRGGHIVNVASVAGLMGAPWHAAYSASKAGLIGMSEALYFDLRPHRIGVTVVCPGGVDTPLQETVEILGADKGGKRLGELKKFFGRHAISPDAVAQQILAALKKKKFLVITSADVRFGYFFKHHAPPLYRVIMFRIAGLLNSLKKADNDSV